MRKTLNEFFSRMNLPNLQPVILTFALTFCVGALANEPTLEVIAPGKTEIKSESPLDPVLESKSEAKLQAKSEAEIPVKLPSKNIESRDSQDGNSRTLLYGFGGLLVVLGGLAWGLKRFTFRSSQEDKNKIKILTQHYLGPKKSLAIVQVAGESVLVGITDHHISLVKTLSLLDEEVPELDDSNFNKKLNETAEVTQVADADSEEFTIKEIGKIRERTRFSNGREFRS